MLLFKANVFILLKCHTFLKNASNTGHVTSHPTCPLRVSRYLCERGHGSPTSKGKRFTLNWAPRVRGRQCLREEPLLTGAAPPAVGLGCSARGRDGSQRPRGALLPLRPRSDPCPPAASGRPEDPSCCRGPSAGGGRSEPPCHPWGLKARPQVCHGLARCAFAGVVPRLPARLVASPCAPLCDVPFSLATRAAPSQ